ncbi:MAG: NAD(P)-dependent alcohol dehydrogenase [Pleurocapsa minor GSE-CHR-MK-17-07R]|jgi:NADPH:quinone reductase-like Zn-dependent oxidoreductase|nr:NAD(P)-dependent alcohol dehydrogenase [Pleurocapsa minor GSE-CHR-MK 17-07R]
MNTTMNAIIYTQYGSPDVLQFKEVEKPTPKDNEVLIKVYASSLNAADSHYMRGTPWLFRLACGIQKPRNIRFGGDVAGRVEAVGKNITQFRLGDEVFGDLSGFGRGALAEYVCAPEEALVLKPANISFEEAAAMPVASVTALGGLRNKGQIQAGQRVLINGASGGVGSFAVQIAKSFGAEVTAVCSTSKMDMVRSLGADHVIDYTKEDFTRNGQRYDFILAANGYHPMLAYQRALSPEGTYVTTGGTMAQYFESMLMGPLVSMRGQKRMGNWTTKPNQADLTYVRDLVQAGKVKPAIDRAYLLHETGDGMRHFEKGSARGKIVITV